MLATSSASCRCAIERRRRPSRSAILQRPRRPADGHRPRNRYYFGSLLARTVPRSAPRIKTGGDAMAGTDGEGGGTQFAWDNPVLRFEGFSRAPAEVVY